MHADDLIITLTQLPGVGPRTVLDIVRALRDEWPEGPADLHKVVVSTKQSRPSVRTLELDAVKRAHEASKVIRVQCSDKNIMIINVLNSKYPESARMVRTPPPVLYVKGSEKSLRACSVAIVGTRRPTDYATRVAYRMGVRSAESGIAVVSGLAVGCDAQAHAGCLQAGGVCVAVLPCGLDQVYPRRHADLANEILEHDGSLVSEYPPGTETADFRLVARDRLQAILSAGVIVVQSSAEGGSMHAARYAIEKLSRPVAAVVPDEVSQGVYSGNQAIISQLDGYPLHQGQQLQDFLTYIRALACQDSGETAPLGQRIS